MHCCLHIVCLVVNVQGWLSSGLVLLCQITKYSYARSQYTFYWSGVSFLTTLLSSQSLSLVAVFQGVRSSRPVLNRMTAHHLQIHVEVTSAPGVPRLVPSAFMSQQNKTLPEILSVNKCTHRFTISRIMKNNTEHISGSLRVLEK